jgi:pimeloyl-ACP methyl ester carboxylesterase
MNVTAQQTEFFSHGARCGADLFLPEGPGPHPAVVLCHGLGATREMGMEPYARAFAEAGIAALAFTYRHFGDSEGEPRQLLDVGRQREDIAAAVEHVKSLPEIDAARIGLFGSSFGGGHVIEVGADRDDIACVVSQCPFTDGIASGMTLGPVSTVKVTGRAIADDVARIFGRGPVYSELAGARGAPAMMTAPDVVDGYFALVPEGEKFDNRVAGRLGLQIIFERPGTKLKSTRTPTLVCACEKDTVAPYGRTVSLAKKGKNVTLKSYAFGHFDIYVGEGFAQTIVDQVEFLRTHLKP